MSAAKQKGTGFETECVNALIAAGLQATRVPGSGAFARQLGPDFAGDIVVEGLRVECKRRKSGFSLLYRAFEQDQSDIVVVRADRQPRLWLFTEALAIELLKYRTAVNTGALLPPVSTNHAPNGENLDQRK